jgi:CTP synthase (UTP-ammonia lyase)
MTRIVLLGERNPTFITHQAIDKALDILSDRGQNVEASWIGTKEVSLPELTTAEGLWVLPGTPYENEEIVFEALQIRRTENRPTLGTCGGFQHVVLEFARNELGLETASHEETSPDGDALVIHALPCSLVGEERLVQCVPGTRMGQICGSEPFAGFHFCNFGVNPNYQEALEAGGLHLSAFAEDAGVEALELNDHPFYMGTLFQPQMGLLRGLELHPLIENFLLFAQTA